MNKILLFFVFVIGLNTLAFAGLPTIGNTISQNNFNAGSNSNFFLVGITDGDLALTQNVTVTGVSSNNALLQVSSINFNNSNTFATVNVGVNSVATVTGVVTVTITAMDPDGTVNKNFVLNVGDFYTKGAGFKVYDIIFWQHIVPVKQIPNMDVVISTTGIPQNNEFYRPAHITVGAGLACCGWFTTDQEFSYGFTNAITGYIKPTVSGIYSFANSTEYDATFYINTVPGDDMYAGSLVNTCVGTSCAKQVYLEAYKYYGFHTANWIVYNKNYQLLWTGPGINTYQPIGGSNVYPTYDRIKPVAPTALTLVNKGVQFLTLKWKSSTDNDQVANYNVYKDGVKIATLTDSLYVVTALGANTQYSFAITAVDRTGNESAISNIVSTSTYPPDAVPPAPPTNVNFITISDMSAEISWSGASDVGSEIIGYYVYLNGVLYNTQYTSNTNMVLKVLVPVSANNITVQAIDGAFNMSAKSAVFNFNTLAFDPLTSATGVRKARVNINPVRIARHPGFGLNYAWNNSEFYNTSPSILRQYITELKPGLLRFGDLSSNSVNYSTYVGSGKSVTIGKFMKLCIDNDAYAQFSCGVKNTTDWMLNSATFTRFMEYIGDPTGQTPGGAQRIAEGYITPFIYDIKGLVFEFGDEVWGGTSHNAEIGDDYIAYGQWCRNMAAIIKSSPYYDSTKIFLSYSGRSPDPADSYALHQKLFTGDHHEVDWISISGYMGGNLNYDTKIPTGSSELKYHQSGTAIMVSNLAGLKSLKDQDFATTGRDRPFYFYEANMTTPNYNGRLGQAVTMCDYFLSSEKLGVAIPSMFALSGGEWSITDASNGYAKLPFFNIAELLNNYTKGNILKSDIETIQILKDENGLSYAGDPVGIHVFNDGGTKYGIAFFSREFDSDYQVQLNLPDNGIYGTLISGSYKAKRYLITGTDFNTRTATTTSSTVPFSDGVIVTVPKFSVVLYLFDGPDMGSPLLPLGSTKYKKIDALKITGNPSINLQYGSAAFSCSGIAANVINKNITWQVLNPDNIDISTNFSTISGFSIYSNGTCESNGVLSLKVMSDEDNTVFDIVNVTISGQVTDGLTDCVNSLALPQTINFPLIPNKQVTSPAFTVSASASSGLTVTFTIISGPASISSDVVTLNGTTGTVVVRATQPGNSTYAAANYVDQSFTVSSGSLQNQTISLNTIDDKQINSPSFSISATASSGLTVTYSIVSGPANLTGSMINLTGATGTVVVKASQAGNGTYNPAPDVYQSFQVVNATLQSQTITFNSIPTKLTTDPAFALNASASSGLPVSFSVVSGPASISNNTLVLQGTIGVVVVKAIQAGNGSFNPASPVTQIFLVSSPVLQNQTISFDAIDSKRGTDLPFNLIASATSGLSIVFELVSGPAFLNGNIISLSGSDGIVKIRAKQDGNASYNPAAYVEQSFGVCALPAKPTISASGATSFCLGLNVTLTSSASKSYWSTNQTTTSIVVTSSGTYLVTAAGIYGCATASDPVTVNVQVPPVQEICLVTVDDATGYNQVVFEKASNRSNVDRYKIMRETDVTNQFDYMGTLFKNEMSVFSDNTSNPVARSYRYKIELTDVCGNKSYGGVHQTMHLTINKGLNANTWNLIWSAYEGITVTSYRIYRGVSPSSLTFLESVSGNFSTYTDNNAPVAASLYYVVEILSNGCNPQARTESYSVARSNIANTSSVVNSVVVQVTNLSVNLFPNPSDGNFHLKSNVAGKINIYNLIGVKIRSYENKVTEANIEGLQSGIYMLEFVVEGKKVIKKVVVE